MDLPGLRPLPPVRVLAVGWGACLTDITDMTNLQLAISTAVAATGGALLLAATTPWKLPHSSHVCWLVGDV